MTFDSIRDYCLQKKGVTEEIPFGPDTLVFKVMGKMFVLIPIDHIDVKVSLKNTPESNLELRALYPSIEGAFHMNKKHWNRVSVDNTISIELLKKLIDESYALVVNGLSRKVKLELSSL